MVQVDDSNLVMTASVSDQSIDSLGAMVSKWYEMTSPGILHLRDTTTMSRRLLKRLVIASTLAVFAAAAFSCPVPSWRWSICVFVGVATVIVGQEFDFVIDLNQRLVICHRRLFGIFRLWRQLHKVVDADRLEVHVQDLNDSLSGPYIHEIMIVRGRRRWRVMRFLCKAKAPFQECEHFGQLVANLLQIDYSGYQTLSRFYWW